MTIVQRIMWKNIEDSVKKEIISIINIHSLYREFSLLDYILDKCCFSYLSQSLSSPLSSLPSPSLPLSEHLSNPLSESLYPRPDSFSQERREIDFKMQQPTTTTTTENFSGTSRGPMTKCYTFLETSLDLRLESQLRCKNFANFFATLFCNPIK